MPLRHIVVLAVLLGLTACAEQKPVAPSNLQSAQVVQPDRSVVGRLSYIKPNTDFRKYNQAIIEPVQIYSGADTSWGNTSPEDRRILADYMAQKFTPVIDRYFRPTMAPGPRTLRFRLILVEVEPNVPGLATLSRLAPAGLVANIAASGTGNPGSFSGSVTYAVEVFDSESGALLAAGVNKKFPDALDIASTLSTVDAAKAGLADGAAQLGRSISSLRAR